MFVVTHAGILGQSITFINHNQLGLEIARRFRIQYYHDVKYCDIKSCDFSFHLFQLQIIFPK